MSCIQSISIPQADGSARACHRHDRGSLGRYARALFHHVAAWMDRGRQRHALAELDRRLLDDIGVTQEAAAREAAKPFWRE